MTDDIALTTRNARMFPRRQNGENRKLKSRYLGKRRRSSCCMRDMRTRRKRWRRRKFARFASRHLSHSVSIALYIRVKVSAVTAARRRALSSCRRHRHRHRHAKKSRANAQKRVPRVNVARNVPARTLARSASGLGESRSSRSWIPVFFDNFSRAFLYNPISRHRYFMKFNLVERIELKIISSRLEESAFLQFLIAGKIPKNWRVMSLSKGSNTSADSIPPLFSFRNLH